jgi:hypothetical protein
MKRELGEVVGGGGQLEAVFSRANSDISIFRLPRPPAVIFRNLRERD